MLFRSIPIEYRSFLLAAPITAHVSSVGRSRLDEAGWCQSKGRRTTVTLDAGSAKGVKLGMEFHVLSPPRLFLAMKVTKVEVGASEGEVFQCNEDALPSLKWILSTRAGAGDR